MGPRDPHRMIPHGIRAGLGALALGAALGACSAPPRVEPITPAELPRFDRATLPADGAYRIEPGDRIAIRYVHHGDLDREETVRTDGRIRSDGAGEIVVAGLRTRDVERELATAAGATLRDPEVSVAIVEFAPRWVYVAGEVGEPGPIAYRRGITALQALMEAGGVLDTALLDSVVLVRAEGPEGAPVSRRVDFEKALAGEAPIVPMLAPRDVLFVPRSGIAEAGIWVDQHVTQLFPFFRGLNSRVGN
jgi:polysaccharide biosynthesis/export protein PslD